MENVLNEPKKNWIKRLIKYFTTYEKIWMLVIVLLALGLAIFFPEEDVRD